MRRRRLDFWLGLSTLLFAAATAIIFFGFRGRTRPVAANTSEQFRVKPMDDGGRIRVDWNAESGAARKAENATLVVQDGGSTESYPVDGKVLREGGFDYVRKSDNVLLVLTLNQQGKPLQRAYIRTLSPVVNYASRQVEPAPQRSSSQTRARRRR